MASKKPNQEFIIEIERILKEDRDIRSGLHQLNEAREKLHKMLSQTPFGTRILKIINVKGDPFAKIVAAGILVGGFYVAKEITNYRHPLVKIRNTAHVVEPELAKFKKAAKLHEEKLNYCRQTLDMLDQYRSATGLKQRTPIPTPNYQVKDQGIFFARNVNWEKEPLLAKLTGGDNHTSAVEALSQNPAGKMLTAALSVVPSFCFSEDGMPEEIPTEHYNFRYLKNKVTKDLLTAGIQFYQNPLEDMKARMTEIRYLYEDQDRRLALLQKKINKLKESRIPAN